MNSIFSDFLNICVKIYFDDILIYSNNMFIHYQYVKKYSNDPTKPVFNIKLNGVFITNLFTFYTTDCSLYVYYN